GPPVTMAPSSPRSVRSLVGAVDDDLDLPGDHAVARLRTERDVRGADGIVVEEAAARGAERAGPEKADELRRLSGRGDAHVHERRIEPGVGDGDRVGTSQVGVADLNERLGDLRTAVGAVGDDEGGPGSSRLSDAVQTGEAFVAGGQDERPDPAVVAR